MFIPHYWKLYHVSIFFSLSPFVVLFVCSVYFRVWYWVIEEKKTKQTQTFMWMIRNILFLQQRCERYILFRKKNSLKRWKLVYRPKIWNCFRVSMDSTDLSINEHEFFHLKMNVRAHAHAILFVLLCTNAWNSIDLEKF